MKRKKIFIDGRPIRRPFSGVAQYTARLVQHFDFKEFDYSLTTNNLSEVSDFYSELSVPTPSVVKEIKMNRKLWTGLLRYAPAGGRWLPFVRDADLIHITQFELFPKYLKRSIKKVLTIHDLIFLDHPEWFTPRNLKISNLVLSQLLQQEIDCVITPSQYTKNRLIQAGYVGRIEVTPLASTIDSKLSPQPDNLGNELRNRQPFFLYIGNLEPRKGLVNLIKAWKNTSTRNYYQLVLAGKYAYLSEQIKFEIESAVSEGFNILHLGYVTENQKLDLLKNAYCLVYPSESEGFGIPILDAMSVGLPVISCVAGSIPEIASGCAHLVRPGQIEPLANAIDEITKNEKYRNELASNGQENAAKYSWHKTASLTESIYRELLELK